MVLRWAGLRLTFLSFLLNETRENVSQKKTKTKTKTFPSAPVL
jgi:hypothetical protein